MRMVCVRLFARTCPVLVVCVRYGGRVVSIIVEECHVVRAWKDDFREQYGELPELRSSVPSVPWGLFTATLKPAAKAELERDLDLHDALLIKGLFTRPNIFLDVQSFDAGDWEQVLGPVLDRLRQDPQGTGRTLIYSVKEISVEVALLLGDEIGQYNAKTGGHLVVDYYKSDASLERKVRVRQDWLLADSKRRVLLATNGLGMGLNMKALYDVYDLDFVKLLADWCQEFGRAGRDGRPARAIVWYSSLRGRAECMRKFINGVKNNRCLRMIIARHFDPTCSLADIRAAQPGATDAEKAQTCCRVCRQRGSMLEPDDALCPCGAVDERRKFCPECGRKSQRAASRPRRT